MCELSVAICTYNGGRYILPQLQSIANQTIIPCEIVVCDDCSQDNTVENLTLFKETSGLTINIFENHSNLGILKNFEKAIVSCSGNYVALCDQDDVWLPHKIEKSLQKIREIENLHGRSTPVLIHTDAKVVDQKLNTVCDSLWHFQKSSPEKGMHLNRLLLQNCATGCTVVINKALIELALPCPDTAMMHDWWLALCASAFGKIGYVREPTVLYRQHQENDIGAKKWGFNVALRQYLSLQNRDEVIRQNAIISENIRNQAAAFLDAYFSKLTASQRRLVEVFIALPNQKFLKRKRQIIQYQLYYSDWLRNAARMLAR